LRRGIAPRKSAASSGRDCLAGDRRAIVLPTAVYATDKDFTDGVLHSQAILKRAAQAVEEVGLVLANRPAERIAAE
jgi:FMN reductase